MYFGNFNGQLLLRYFFVSAELLNGKVPVSIAKRITPLCEKKENPMDKEPVLLILE